MSVHYPGELLRAAKDLLNRLDNITTEELSQGGEHNEREALRKAIAKAEGKE